MTDDEYIRILRKWFVCDADKFPENPTFYKQMVDTMPHEWYEWFERNTVIDKIMKIDGHEIVFDGMGLIYTVTDYNDSHNVTQYYYCDDAYSKSRGYSIERTLRPGKHFIEHCDVGPARRIYYAKSSVVDELYYIRNVHKTIVEWGEDRLDVFSLLWRDMNSEWWGLCH